jgi:hypothetical protein
MECLKERHGALAWDGSNTFARWLTDGRLQEGPNVVFFDPDLYNGKRAGFTKQGSDEIHIARGLSFEETLATVAHEVSHAVSYSCEAEAQVDERWLTRRYLESIA